MINNNEIWKYEITNLGETVTKKIMNFGKMVKKYVSILKKKYLKQKEFGVKSNKKNDLLEKKRNTKCVFPIF